MAIQTTCVFTVNIGSFLTENSRRSITAAAKRWGAHYLEVTQSYGQKRPCSVKNYVAAHLTYDRVLYLDADVLVRHDAPNPFELFPENRFYVVRDIQSHHTPEQREYLQKIIQDRFLRWASYRTGLTASIKPEDFFNSGVCLWSLQQRRIWQAWLDRKPPEPWLGNHVEQALLNLCAAQFPGEVSYLDETWNRLNPPLDGPMQDVVYHFTGCGFKELRNRVCCYDWQETGARFYASFPREPVAHAP